MALGTLLQAIISIIFIYLILSLLVSELQEYLATIFEARAKRLKESIRQMLGELSLKCIDREQAKFQVCSPAYENSSGIFDATWEQQYSLQDELSIRSKQGLQKHLGQDPIEASAENTRKAWIEARVVREVDNEQAIFQENNNDYIWTGKTNNSYGEFIASDVIVDAQNPDQGFVKNACRLAVISNHESLGAGALAWINKNNLVQPVSNQNYVVQEAEGKRRIWIANQSQQEVDPVGVDSETASKFEVYDLPAELPPESKLWIQGQEIRLIPQLDQDKIQDDAFVWVNMARHAILDPGALVLDPGNPEVASDKSICVKKYPVYQLLMPLRLHTRYYVDHHNQIRPPLEVKSLTEKIYQHPKIEALNQSAASWLSLLKISFSFLPMGLRHRRKSGEENQNYRLNLALNLASLLTIFLLACIILKLWYGIGYSAFLYLGILLLIRILAFLMMDNMPRSKGITRNSLGPSYINDSNLFVEVLIDVLQKETDQQISDNHPDGIKRCLETLSFYTPAQSVLLERVAQSSIETLDAFKQDLKNVYEEVQRRSSGVYKRNAKGLSFVVGLLIACVANADTFNMLSHLTRTDNQFAKNLIRQLDEDPSLFQCQAGTDCFDEAKQAKFKSMIDNQSTLPLGWSFNELLDWKNSKAKLESKLNDIKTALNDIKTARETQDTEIKENDKLLEFLSKFQCGSDIRQECLNQLAENYYANPEVRSSLGANDLLAFLKDPKSQGSDFAGAYKTHLDQQRQKNIQLKNSFLQADLARKNQEHTLTEQLNETEKSIRQLEERLATVKPLPQDSRDLLSRLSQVPVASWRQINQSWMKIDDAVLRQGGWPKVFFGWLITAVALSMGAPFWFDTLGRVMNVRNAAKIPDPRNTEPPLSQENRSSS